jgi:hypothetical protein
MRKHFVLSLSFSLVIGLVATDIRACGDKLLVLGQGARVSQFQITKNPRSILLYQRSGLPEGSGIRDSGEIYKRMGHRVRVARDLQQVNEVLRSNKVDYVIADPSDLAMLGQSVGAGPAKPKLIAMTVPARAKVVLYAALIEDAVRK